MEVTNDQLGAFLYDAGLISRSELARAAAIAQQEGLSLADMLVQRGMVGDDDVRRATALALGVPFILLDKQTLRAEDLMRLPEPMARIHNAVISGVQGQKLEVALLDTNDIKPIQDFFGSEWTVAPRLTSRASIKHALMHYQKILKDLFGGRIAEEIQSLERSHQMKDQRGSVDASVRAVDALLQHALHMKAREVHVNPSPQGLRVRYRLGAGLYDAVHLPAHAAPLLGARFKSLANIPLASSFGTGRFKMSPEGAQNDSVSVTVSTMPVVSEHERAEKFVLTLVYEHADKSGFSLSALGVAPHNIESIQSLLHRKSGLVLVCGAEGSGKTSMLYTLLDECADVSKNLASVEETVSHALPAVAQVGVDESLGLTALSCLRAQLRQHPDILMIDCPLTEELALLSVQAANRGTLVLLGVEAVTAGEGISQLLALGVPAELLAAVCIGSIGVHTAHRLCTHQTIGYKPTRAEQSLLEDTVDIKATLAALKNEQVIDARTAWKDVELHQPTPCPHCADGFSGLVGLQEVVPMSRMLKELVRGGAGAYALEIGAKEDGVLTLAEDALYKAIQGVISAGGALEVAAGYQARYE